MRSQRVEKRSWFEPPHQLAQLDHFEITACLKQITARVSLLCTLRISYRISGIMSAGGCKRVSTIVFGFPSGLVHFTSSHGHPTDLSHGRIGLPNSQRARKSEKTWSDRQGTFSFLHHVPNVHGCVSVYDHNHGSWQKARESPACVFSKND